MKKHYVMVVKDSSNKYVLQETITKGNKQGVVYINMEDFIKNANKTRKDENIDKKRTN